MLKEFFWSASWRTTGVAWGGFVVVVGYAYFLASVKARLNDFYSTFYDLLQKGGDVDPPSGEYEDTYADYRAQVTSELYKFAMIVLPLVSATPACKWARSAWAFVWRTALMRAYLEAWDTQREPIEGASQRLHEDTQRFSFGLEGCLITLLDAVFTLCVFTPILLGLSKEIAPPFDMGQLRDSWLFGMAFTCSIVGLVGAALLGQKLVGLEVSNQKVEALLRKDLVLLETTPAVIVGTRPSSDDRYAAFLPQTYFRNTLESLHKNYFALFKHFGVLNCWLSFFDQVMVLAPYAIAAPLVFAANLDDRITLGTLIKMSNSFEKVFASLSVIAENWGAINDFRSTYRRLSEFESKLYPPVNGFGWRRPRIGAGISRSSSGTSTTTQLTEVRPRGETVHEVLGEPMPADERSNGRSEAYDRSAGATPTRPSDGECPPPQYEMRV
jgi:ABC-type long-subunit fatty acid transport system fused permease/ATPase subunit